MGIKFGPAGLGPVSTAEKVLEGYAKKGLKACEIAFTYSIYIKKKEDAERIGKRAKELGISLSIHAPYWINLNSDEKEKREKSKERILGCCEIGHHLGATNVVFHPGYYGKNREGAQEVIIEEVKDMMKTIKKKGWTTKIAPETMGKINVFGSVDEVAKLVKASGCSFCIDFAHILARQVGKKPDYTEIKKLFPGKDWHVHFSGIIYGDKGERKHKKTTKAELKELLKNLPKNKDIVIINESPDMVNDSVDGLNLSKKI